MKYDICDIIEDIKSKDVGGNGKVLLHEGSQIRIESSDDVWDDDEGRISIYVPKENLPRNMSSITYDLDKMENVIDKAIYDTQDKYNKEYCKIDEAYAQECAKYADAENRGESDLDWTNYIKPIADALKENNCIVVPFWLGEHSCYSVSADGMNNEFLTRDYKDDPSKSLIDLRKEIKKVILSSNGSDNPRAFFVDKDFDISTIQTNKPMRVSKWGNDIDCKVDHDDFAKVEKILSELNQENKWKDYNDVKANAPTGIAYINRDELPNKSDEEIATYLMDELENRFEAYLNGWLYSVVVDNCVEAWGLTNDELENYIDEIKLNENSQVVDESVIDFLENNDDECIETIKAKITKRQR